MKNILNHPKVAAALAQNQTPFLLTTLAFAVVGFILPWWSIMLVAGVVGWNQNTLLKAILRPLLACFAAWILLTLAFDAVHGFRISTRLGGLVGLQIPLVANLIAASLGGILAALSAATVQQFKKTLFLLRSQ